MGENGGRKIREIKGERRGGDGEHEAKNRTVIERGDGGE